MDEQAEAQEDELCGSKTEEAYKAVGEELQWDVLGTPVVEGDFFAFREEPGTLAEERWKQFEWTKNFTSQMKSNLRELRN